MNISTLFLNLFILISAGSMLAMNHKIKESHRNNLRAQPVKNFAELMKLGQCQTLFGTEHESSVFYRKCAFEALTNCGHEHPVIVGIVNKVTDIDACSGHSTLPLDGKKYIFINFNEKYWDDWSHGTVRFVMHHEASHLVLRDYCALSATNVESRKIERRADKNAAKKVGCKRCVESAVKRYLKLNRQDPKDPKYYPKLTFQDLKNMKQDTLNKMIDEVEALSEKSGSTHPLHIERALRLYRYTLILPGVCDNNKLCEHHERIERLEYLDSLKAIEDKIAKATSKDKLKMTVCPDRDKARAESIARYEAWKKDMLARKEQYAIRNRDLERILRKHRIA